MSSSDSNTNIDNTNNKCVTCPYCSRDFIKPKRKVGRPVIVDQQLSLKEKRRVYQARYKEKKASRPVIDGDEIIES